jgi:DNA polymerase-3 subunit delta'
VSGAVWDGIVGQAAAVALLQRAVGTDRLAHAYAFIGPAGVGRRLTALALAQATLCPAGGCGACSACRRVAAGRHPDCQVVAPEPPRDNPRGAPALRIEQVREIEHAASLAPFEGRRKVFVLDDADRLTLPTAQALLKTLEEPPPRTLLVLVIANPRALPATVRSRCQPVRFRALPEAAAAELLERRGIPPPASRLLARLTQGQVGLALGADLADMTRRRDAALALTALPPAELPRALDEAGLDRDRAQVTAWLETYWLWYRDALCLAAGAGPAVVVNGDRIEALTSLARTVPVPDLVARLAAVKDAWLALEGNVTPRLALEHVLLELAA